MGEPETLVRIRVRNAGAIIAAGAAIERLAIGHGIDPLEARRFCFTVEELCTERLLTAFGTGEQPEAILTLELRPGELALIVRDTGSPIEPAAGAADCKGWLAQLLGRGFADGLHASFDGRQGNHCEILKSLSNVARADFRHSTMLGCATKAEVEGDAGPPHPRNFRTAESIQYRDMRPEDALEVARCFCRTYGLTAPVADEAIYHPEKCAERVRAGLHLGTVAVLPEGRIVGHIAVTRDHLNDPIGVSGFLVVDPELRGHGIADRLSDTKPMLARRAGMRGLLGMAVTVHTASQKTCLREGGYELGVLLAAQESRVAMHAIAADARHERHAIIPFFIRLAPDISRVSFVPAAYKSIAADIYRVCGLDRTIGEAPVLEPMALAERTALAVTVLEGARFAKIRIESYGREFLKELFHLVQDLHHNHVPVIRLELPLADPLTAVFSNAIEPLGFSFAAIFPAMEPGDLLCMQSIDRIAVDPAAIQIASDHGAAVLAMVLASRERMLSSNSNRTLADAAKALRFGAVRPTEPQPHTLSK